MLHERMVSEESAMEGCTSEELMLDCAFNACDFEGAGEVPVYRILEYLQNVTGKSLEEEGLCSLYRMLDPEERGVSLNLETFHTIMANWIAECRQEWVLEGTKEEDNLIESVYLQPCGMAVASSPPQLEGYGGDSQKCSLGEAADLMSSIENLEFTNKKLTDQNTKLQRSLELSDESVARLHEEIAQLKNDLKSTQTALQHAKSNVDELEDLKAVTKSLEERNGELQSRSRQLEKELQCLNIQLQMLRKENGNLLTERERERKKTEDLIAERTALKEQLCEYERFISQKDLLLSERMKQAEELKGTVEEYRAMTQELKVEITRLQERMSQTSGDLIRMSDDSSEIAPSILRFQLQSLCMEIEELDQGGCIDDGLPSPLVGVFPWSSFAAFTVEVLLVELCTEMRASDFWFATEELLTECQEGLMAVLQCLPPDQDNKNLQERLPATVKHLRKDLEEQSGIFQQRLGYLTDLKMTWEGYLYKLKVGLQRFKQLDKKEKTECIGSSTSIQGQEEEDASQGQDRSSTEGSAAGTSVPTTSARASGGAGNANQDGGDAAPAAGVGEPAAVAGGATSSQPKPPPNRKEIAAMARHRTLEAICTKYRWLVALADKDEEVAAAAASSNAAGSSQAPSVVMMVWFPKDKARSKPEENRK
ncbi:protein KASH5 isoform X7 [Lissotriton helveticus]